MVEHVVGWMDQGYPIATAPGRLVDLIAARVSRLSPPTLRVLQAIAAHGTVVTRSLLETTLGEHGGAVQYPARDDLRFGGR